MTNYELILTAYEVIENSYAPYSGFNVGAALLAESGKIYTGVNVENSSYGATICAERTAFVKAISEGERSFKKLAVVSSGRDLTWPCGICRQFFSEFCNYNFEIISGDKEGNIKVYTLSELFPEGFKL